MKDKENINSKSYILIVFILFIIEIILYLGFRKNIFINGQVFFWLFICFNVFWGIIYGLSYGNKKKNKNYYLKIITLPSILFGVIAMLALSLFALIQFYDFVNNSLNLRSSFFGVVLSFFMVILWVGGFFLVGYILVKFVKLLEKLLFKKYFSKPWAYYFFKSIIPVKLAVLIWEYSEKNL